MMCLRDVRRGRSSVPRGRGVAGMAEHRIMSPMTHLTLRRATGADEPALAVLATRLTAFELPAWRAPHEISDADARAMIAAAAAGDPDNEVLIAERDGEVVGCLHVLAVTDFFGTRHGHV